MAGPLSGIRIVDLSVNYVGPVASMVLAGMGADVIKVESPIGDGMRYFGPHRSEDMSAMFLNANWNKRSVVLDLKLASAREALLKLAGTADVFVHSMRPKAAAKLGVDYESVRKHRDDIVHCRIAGYSAEGRYDGRGAYDDVIQGASGIAWLNRMKGGEPAFLPMIFADKLCGYVLGMAISSALLGRERTGQGASIELPMFETVTAFNLIDHLWGAALDGPDRGGSMGYPRMFGKSHRPFPTRDGHLCVLGNTDAEWQRIFQVIGRADLLGDARFATRARRMENIVEAYQIVADALEHNTTAYWVEKMTELDICHGPVNSFGDLIDDPHLADVGFFRSYEHPTEGRLWAVPNPFRIAGQAGEIRKPPPRLGEHTRSVLAEIGLTEDDVKA